MAIRANNATDTIGALADVVSTALCGRDRRERDAKAVNAERAAFDALHDTLICAFADVPIAGLRNLGPGNRIYRGYRVRSPDGDKRLPDQGVHLVLQPSGALRMAWLDREGRRDSGIVRDRAVGPEDFLPEDLAHFLRALDVVLHRHRQLMRRASDRNAVTIALAQSVLGLVDELREEGLLA